MVRRTEGGNSKVICDERRNDMSEWVTSGQSIGTREGGVRRGRAAGHTAASPRILPARLVLQPPGRVRGLRRGRVRERDGWTGDAVEKGNGIEIGD
jgi:hypothetical protein